MRHRLHRLHLVGSTFAVFRHPSHFKRLHRTFLWCSFLLDKRSPLYDGRGMLRRYFLRRCSRLAMFAITVFGPGRLSIRDTRCADCLHLL